MKIGNTKTGEILDLSVDPQPRKIYVGSLAKTDEIDVDGCVDAKGVKFIGKAKRWPDGTWRSLADVNGCLCIVECTVTFLEER
jgi:hypothetical protein